MPNVFRLEELDGQIALLTFDLPDKKVNTLGQARARRSWRRWSAQLEKRTDLRGLLFRSGKPGQFIAGADLNELGALAFASKEQVDAGASRSASSSSAGSASCRSRPSP